MGVLAVTPSNEFAVHGLLPTGPHAGQPDPHPQVQAYVHAGARGGPSTSHFIWDLVTGRPLMEWGDEHERQQVRGRVNTRYTAEERAKNRFLVKRRLHPIAQGIKRARK